MFHRNITRLLHQTSPETKQLVALCRVLHRNENHNHIHIVRKLLNRNLQSSSAEKITRKKRKDDFSKNSSQSLIVQKILQSQRNVEFEAEKDTRTRKESMNDVRLRLENISKDLFSDSEDVADISSSFAENSVDGERTSLPDQFESEDYVENIVLKHDVHSQPKPSPLLGTEDRSLPVSDVPCMGCGALLHCQHRSMPGFLPSERFKLLSQSELRSSICQRCHYIQHCDAFAEVTSSAQDYAQIISEIKPTRSVVIMVVDVVDIPGSIIPNLASYIGHKHPLVIVGNKVDLIAPDSTKYLLTMKKAVMESCSDAGLTNIRKVMLISAKTGFGIERLIDVLFSFYKRKVDVFIVGTANAGKSSLFNALLASDYCRHRARDLIQRATISVWPGTTLNLLKFPIMNPTPRTLARRHQRLKQEKAFRKEAQKAERKKQKEKQEVWELKEEVNTTDTRSWSQIKRDNSDAAWGQDVFAYKGSHGGITSPLASDPSSWTPETYDPTTYSHSYWMYDTPGVINPNQTFNLLDPDECPILQPVDTMTPRCVLLKPGTAIFISGLARLDYVEGTEVLMTVVHCSPSIPLKVVSIREADQFYLQHAGTLALGIPLGDRERLDRLPSLVGREITLVGDDDKSTVADVQLSSIGWVSLAPKSGSKVKVTAYTPARRGICVRSPSLLPSFLQFKGKRIRGTPFFWPRRVGLPVTGKLLSTEDHGDDNSLV